MAESLDLLFVVGNLDAETSVLQETILLELLHDALDHSLTESSGVNGTFLGVQWTCRPPREHAPTVPEQVLDRALDRLLELLRKPLGFFTGQPLSCP